MPDIANSARSYRTSSTATSTVFRLPRTRRRREERQIVPPLVVSDAGDPVIGFTGGTTHRERALRRGGDDARLRHPDERLVMKRLAGGLLPALCLCGIGAVAGDGDRNASAARSGPAGAEAEATSAMRRGTCGSLGPWRATLIRARSASARAARGLHVSEDRAFGA